MNNNITSSELADVIKKIRPYLEGVKKPLVPNNQYESIEDYNSKKEYLKNFNSQLKFIDDNLPLNEWIKVNIDGIEKGIIHIETRTEYGFFKGYYLIDWKEKMPPYYIFAKQKMTWGYIKKNLLIFIVGLIGVLLAIMMILEKFN